MSLSFNEGLEQPSGHLEHTIAKLKRVCSRDQHPSDAIFFRLRVTWVCRRNVLMELVMAAGEKWFYSQGNN